MPRIRYQSFRFSAATQQTIATCISIIAEYQAQGYSLTLRQLYYQCVARGYIANKDTEYKRLGSIITDARLAGLIDWYAIEDRTRNVRALPHWADAQDMVHSAALSYRIDKWAPEYQRYRVVCMIEKDALVGVIEGVCNELQIPYFSCRGYTSQSEMWSMAQRLLKYERDDQVPVILHLGDHDPSGKDMTRDIIDRLALFTHDTIEVQRLALNWDQIEQYAPPPNPAKLTDSRSTAYIAEFGYESWELDALAPDVIANLIRDAVYLVRNEDTWEAAVQREEGERVTLMRAYENWEHVAEYIDNQYR